MKIYTYSYINYTDHAYNFISWQARKSIDVVKDEIKKFAQTILNVTEQELHTPNSFLEHYGMPGCHTATTDFPDEAYYIIDIVNSNDERLARIQLVALEVVD